MNSLDEQFPNEGFGRRLKLDQVGEILGGRRWLHRQQNIPGLFQRQNFDVQVAVVVGSSEEREYSVSMICGHD